MADEHRGDDGRQRRAVDPENNEAGNSPPDLNAPSPGSSDISSTTPEVQPRYPILQSQQRSNSEATPPASVEPQPVENDDVYPHVDSPDALMVTSTTGTAVTTRSMSTPRYPPVDQLSAMHLEELGLVIEGNPPGRSGPPPVANREIGNLENAAIDLSPVVPRTTGQGPSKRSLSLNPPRAATTSGRSPILNPDVPASGRSPHLTGIAYVKAHHLNLITSTSEAPTRKKRTASTSGTPTRKNSIASTSGAPTGIIPVASTSKGPAGINHIAFTSGASAGKDIVASTSGAPSGKNPLASTSGVPTGVNPAASVFGSTQSSLARVPVQSSRALTILRKELSPTSSRTCPSSLTITKSKDDPEPDLTSPIKLFTKDMSPKSKRPAKPYAAEGGNDANPDDIPSPSKKPRRAPEIPAGTETLQKAEDDDVMDFDSKTKSSRSRNKRKNSNDDNE